MQPLDHEFVSTAGPGDRGAGWTRRLTSIPTWYLVVGSMLATLVLSVLAGPDANWDLRNYHYYNGRAIVTWSFLHDVAPAGIQTYSNPWIDVPLYLAIRVFGWHWGLILWTAILQWFCYMSVWRLTGEFARLRESLELRLGAFLLALAGSGAWSIAFTTFGDWAVAGLLCESLVRLMRSRQASPEHAARELILAGLFAGLAMGVKMTAATFVLALAVAVVAVGGWRVLRFVGAAGAGFLALHGVWMVVLLVRFDNPLFPYYNRLFRSDSAPYSNFDDARYGATSVKDIARFPWNMARGGIKYSELLLQDWRFLAFVVICVVAALVLPTQRVTAVARDRAFWMFPSLLLVGFTAWIVVFGIYRYFLFGELLVSILVAVLLAELVHDRFKAVVCLAVLGTGGLAFQTLPEWGRGDILRNDALAEIVRQRPDVPSHVVFVGPPPFGYLAEAFPSDTRFAALFAYDSNELRLAGPLAEQLDSFLAAGEADDGLNVIVDAGLPSLPAPLSNYTTSECQPFESLGRPLEMCALVRVGDSLSSP